MADTLALSQLSDKQRAFVTSKAKKVLYEGAFRCGKTVAGAFRLILLAHNFPGNRIVVARRTYRRLFDTTVATFYDWCPPDLILKTLKKEDKVLIRTKGGGKPTEILWRSLESPDELGQVKNLDLGAIWLDQSEEFAEDTYKALLSRLTLRHVPYRSIFLTANPPVTPEHWQVTHFPYEVEEVSVRGQWKFGGPDWELLVGDMDDNKANLPDDFSAGLTKDYADDWVSVYVRGTRGAIRSGLPVFTHFDRDRTVRVIERAPYKLSAARCQYLISWDFGRVRPAVLWCRAISRRDAPDKPIVQVLKAFLGQNVTTPTLAKMVLEWTRQEFGFVSNREWVYVGDPRSAWKENEANGVRIADLLADEGIALVRLPYTDPCGRADLINRYLEARLGDDSRVQIAQECTDLIAGLAGGYHRKMPRPGEAVSDTPVKDGFYEHLIDALGFAVQYVDSGGALPRPVLGAHLARQRMHGLASTYSPGGRREADLWT